MSIKQMDIPYEQEKQEALIGVVNRYPQLAFRKGLDRFYWPFQINAAGKNTDHAYAAIKAYLEAIKPRMHQPVLHLWGEAGTGKTHLATSLAAYLMLNEWTIGTGPDDQFESFAYVDWPYFIQTQLDDEQPLAVNWEAQVLILDDLDRERPIPRSGDTFRLSICYRYLKVRLTQTMRPTIILTRSSLKDLETFLATNAKGEVARRRSPTLGQGYRLIDWRSQPGQGAHLRSQHPAGHHRQPQLPGAGLGPTA